MGLFTARPFDYKGAKIALSAQGGSNTLTRDFQPRLTGLISKNWGNFGILVSGAYSRRNTREEGFDTYRWRRNKANGSNISRLTAAEQAKINSGDLLFARGNRLSVWDSKQERIGLTSSIQWAPTDKVHVTLDGLYGQFKGDRFETHLASRGGGSSTWLGGGETFAGTVYPNSRVNAIQWNDRNEVTYLDVSGGKASTETRVQNTKNVFKQVVLSGDAELVDGLTFTWLGGVERSRYDMPVNDKFTLEGFGDVISDYRGGTYSLVNTYKFNTTDPNFWHAKRLYANNTFQDSAFDNIKGRFDYKLSPATRSASAANGGASPMAAIMRKPTISGPAGSCRGRSTPTPAPMPGPIPAIRDRTGRSSTSQDAPDIGHQSRAISDQQDRCVRGRGADQRRLRPV